MPRTFDDIIPPSRRRRMEEESQQGQQQIPVEPEPYQPAPGPVEAPADEYGEPMPEQEAAEPTNTTPLPPASHHHHTSNPFPNTSYAPSSRPSQDYQQAMPPAHPPRIKIKVGRSFPYGTALIVLVIIAVCAGVLYANAGAEVKVVPTTQTGSVSGDFTATQGSGSLPFTVVTFTKTDSMTVPAESTTNASTSAQGTIVISNAQTKPQQLITNTRFQTDSGLVYRIHSAVTIPAATASGPGKVTATVYADQPGQSFNIGPSSFTLPGLKGDPAYTLVTAQSTGPIAGGYSGVRPSVSMSTDLSTQASLQTKLASELQAGVGTKLPQGYVIIPGGSTTNYEALPDTASSTSVVVSEQGTVNAIAFPSSALAQAIAYKIAGTYSGQPVQLLSPSTLSLTPDATSTNLSSATSYSFSLSGNATIIWQVDQSKIAGAVAGKTRDSAQSILAGFPEVQSAVLTLRPFWDSTFPQDPSHIHVIVQQPSATGAK